MAINDDIVFSKGIFSVTIFTTQPTENYKNQLQIHPNVQTKENQDQGGKDPIVVDLLRQVKTFHIEGAIHATASKTTQQIKSDLISIWDGGGTKGGTTTMTYEDTSYSGFIEDLVIKKNQENAVAVTAGSYSGKDTADYRVTVTFVVGKEAI